MHRRVIRAALIGLLVAAVGEPGLGGEADQGPIADRRPRLVLLITVDQLGATELERIGSLFRGGFRYLMDHGLSFTQAHHAHAITETAPGHATLSSGRFPRHHGIVANWWIEPGNPEKRWSIDDDDYEESPRQLLTSSLGDWLKEHDPSSKVYAASGKDRSAILMGGKAADGAFWYDEESGRFKTSAYYDEPEWLTGFNDRRLLDAYYGEAWEPLPLPQQALESLQIEPLDLGPLQPGFPHVLGGLRPAPIEDFYKDVVDSPWLDRYLYEFARQIVAAEDLGEDASPDLLALGFSAADAIGHDFGPNSREYVDLLLRLDGVLQELLDFIDGRVGLDRVVIGLSADHGVVPVPEVRQRQGLPGRRADAEAILCLQQVGRRLSEAHGVPRWLVSGPFLAPELSERTGSSRAALEEETARQMEQCRGVAAVWTRSELLAPPPGPDPQRQLFVNSFHPERSPDFLLRFDEYFMTSIGVATTHGTAYAYDRWVPFVVLAPGLEPGVVSAPVRSVDMAPTLAALAGVPFPPEVDGRDLTSSRRAQDSARLRQ